VVWDAILHYKHSNRKSAVFPKHISGRTAAGFRTAATPDHYEIDTIPSRSVAAADQSRLAAFTLLSERRENELIARSAT